MSSASYILVTGGAGYIGSHTVVELLEAGHKVVIVDNLVNSSYAAVARVSALARQEVVFVEADIRDRQALTRVFSTYAISAVIHFAALKAVGESTLLPLKYYANNIDGAIGLMEVMAAHNVKNIVFSSSATVYGDATRFEGMIPIPEECPTGPTSPYGQTKLTVENLIRDVCAGDSEWNGAILRYFNPIGAHPSGLIGEDPLGIPNNLLPYLAQVAVGRRAKLSVFGNDYDSRDGTPIRDYIHVVDLARGHLAALRYLEGKQGVCREWNLGSGVGSTVMEVYAAFCSAVGTELPFEVAPRRAGDVLNLTAKPDRATAELGWSTTLTVEDACRDLWRWTQASPQGYTLEGYTATAFAPNRDPAHGLHTVTVGDFSVAIANYGATIVSVKLGGKELQTGFTLEAAYRLEANPFFGATIGRVANRLAGGAVTVASSTVPLVEGTTFALHGGPQGYDKQLFLGPVVTQKEGQFRLEFVHEDPDGFMGFPGAVLVTVVYTVGAGVLGVEYTATSTKETIVSLTNHAYWNLGGGDDIGGTEITLVSNRHQEVEGLIPTGRFVEMPLVVTFAQLALGTAPLVLGPEGPCIDHCFEVSEARDTGIDTRERPMVTVAQAFHPRTLIEMTVSTTEPSVQLYTGDAVDVPAGELTGKGFGKRCGFTLESARFINAARFPETKALVVLPVGEVYGARTQFRFRVRQ